MTALVRSADQIRADQIRADLANASIARPPRGHKLVAIPSPDWSDHLKPNEVSSILGVSYEVLRRLRDSGQLPARRIGGASKWWRYPANVVHHLAATEGWR